MAALMQIRDHFHALCNLVCEENLEAVLRQSAQLFIGFFDAHTVLILVLDDLGKRFVVSAGARAGNINWAPKVAFVDISQDRSVNGPLAQVAMTGKPLYLDRYGQGYNMQTLSGLLSDTITCVALLPLQRSDKTLLGCLVVYTPKYFLTGSAEKGTLDLLLKALAALIGKKVTSQRKEQLAQQLRHSFDSAAKDRDVFRDRLVQAIEQKFPGKSEYIHALRIDILKQAKRRAPLMIFGPEGSGVEAVALEIHKASRNYRSPFVYVNCRQLNASNFAALVYGHKRGAIQGVSSPHKGYFREAGAGTILFDRIDCLDVLLQDEFVRVLERGQYRTLGSQVDSSFSARLIFSASPNIALGRTEQDFRAALYYRATRSVITLIPLAQRPEDIDPIIDGLIANFSVKLKTTFEVDWTVRSWLKQQSLEGDMQELESLIERACTRARRDQGRLTLKHFEDTFPAPQQSPSEDATSLPKMLEQYERRLLLQALKQNDFDRTKTAHTLNIPKRTLADKCVKYQL